MSKKKKNEKTEKAMLQKTLNTVEKKIYKCSWGPISIKLLSNWCGKYSWENSGYLFNFFLPKL